MSIPTTIEQFVAEQLDMRGLWPHETSQVIAAMKSSDEPGLPGLDWSDDLSAHPPPFAAVMLLSAKNFARRWLLEHKPDHVALPAFAPPPTAPPTGPTDR